MYNIYNYLRRGHPLLVSLLVVTAAVTAFVPYIIIINTGVGPDSIQCDFI